MEPKPSMKVNDHLVSLKGKAYIGQPLAYDKDYHISGVFSCSGAKEHPNGDGTVDITYYLEPNEVTIQDEVGNSVKMKTKSKKSQAMRMQIIMWARDNMPEIQDDDEAYDLLMTKILDTLPNYLTFLKTKFTM